MPYCEIPVDQLEFINLFGFEIIAEEDTFMLIDHPDGKQRVVDKNKPYLWFEDEDMGDALQLKAVGVFRTPSE